MSPSTISWRATEHTLSAEKRQDWYWALGILAVALAVAAILLHNTLFALVILLAALNIGLLANHAPREHKYSVSVRGVSVDDTLHSYTELHSFWIDTERPHQHVLIVDVRKFLMPHLVIPLPDDFDTEALHDYLLDYLPEERLVESAAHRIAVLLGFL